MRQEDQSARRSIEQLAKAALQDEISEIGAGSGSRVPNRGDAQLALDALSEPRRLFKQSPSCPRTSSILKRPPQRTPSLITPCAFSKTTNTSIHHAHGLGMDDDDSYLYGDSAADEPVKAEVQTSGESLVRWEKASNPICFLYFFVYAMEILIANCQPV